jgi:hypothetical protein
MTGSERDVHVEEHADRILSDDRAAAAYAAFVEAQLRYRGMRNLLARLRAFARLRALARVLAAATAVR